MCKKKSNQKYSFIKRNIYKEIKIYKSILAINVANCTWYN